MRRTEWSENKIERWVKEGRGAGSGAAYKPWLAVRDIPANSRRHRVFSAKFNREIQLCSDIEHQVFLLAEHSPKVLEAEEQRPVDRDLTLKVARELGIRHPHYPGTKIPTVMTVDLLVTLDRNGRRVKVGIDSKAKSELEKSNVVAKLQLMRACLAALGYEHLIVCESQLNPTVTRNLIWLRDAQPHRDELLPYPTYYDDAADRLYEHLTAIQFGATRLQTVCQEFDSQAGWKTGTALRAARMLLGSHRLRIDLRRPDIPMQPMRQFSLDVDDHRDAKVVAL